MLCLVDSEGLTCKGRPAPQHAKAAASFDHAHVKVVTASDAHFSRTQMIEVVEQVLLNVKHDVENRPSPADGTSSLCLHPVIMVSKRVHTNILLSLCCDQEVNCLKYAHSENMLSFVLSLTSCSLSVFTNTPWSQKTCLHTMADSLIILSPSRHVLTTCFL